MQNVAKTVSIAITKKLLSFQDEEASSRKDGPKMFFIMQYEENNSFYMGR